MTFENKTGLIHMLTIKLKQIYSKNTLAKSNVRRGNLNFYRSATA